MKIEVELFSQNANEMTREIYSDLIVNKSEELKDIQIQLVSIDIPNEKAQSHETINLLQLGLDFFKDNTTIRCLTQYNYGLQIKMSL